MRCLWMMVAVACVAAGAAGADEGDARIFHPLKGPSVQNKMLPGNAPAFYPLGTRPVAALSRRDSNMPPVVKQAAKAPPSPAMPTKTLAPARSAAPPEMTAEKAKQILSIYSMPD